MHSLATVLLAGYAVLLLLALLFPTSQLQSDAVTWLGGVLDDAGLPAVVTSTDRLEVVMNVVIVAPLTFLGMLALPRSRWHHWAALGFAAALGLELAQALLLPQRDGSLVDVAANTAGALVGALLALPVRRPLCPSSGGSVG